MTIDIPVLRKAVEKLLTHVEAARGATIEIEDDYYWWISQEERYVPASAPTALTVGQLSDDWSELRAIGDGTREPVGYALVWLATVLARIGELTP